MKPGKQLDALIAEKVMGMNIQRDRAWQTSSGPGGPSIREIGIPQYSTSIEAAWKVVQQFNRFSITKCEMPEHYFATVVFYNGMGSFEEYTAKAETASHAICLAALKAVKTVQGDSESPGEL
jgi:hypothetical protein